VTNYTFIRPIKEFKLTVKNLRLLDLT